MADLGLNTLWSDIDNEVGTVSNDILGPSYSYTDNIPGPTSLGVGSSGSMSQLFTNVSAANEYVKILITGDPPLGNQYYVNTGGTCTAPDGSLKSRYNYINNKSVGADLIPQGLNDLSFLTSDLNGLIPGVVGDLEGLDPLYLFNAMSSDASPACQCYKCEVTSGPQYQFLSTNLSPDFDTNLCSQVDMSFCPNASSTGTESFENRGSSTALPTILAFCALVLLTFSGK